MRLDGRHPYGALPYISISEDELPDWVKPYGLNGAYLYIGMVWGLADAARILTGKMDLDEEEDE